MKALARATGLAWELLAVEAMSYLGRDKNGTSDNNAKGEGGS